MSSRSSSESSHPTSIAFTTKPQHVATSGSRGPYCFARADRFIVSGISVVVWSNSRPCFVEGGSMRRDDLCAIERLLAPTLNFTLRGAVRPACACPAAPRSRADRRLSEAASARFFSNPPPMRPAIVRPVVARDRSPRLPRVTPAALSPRHSRTVNTSGSVGCNRVARRSTAWSSHGAGHRDRDRRPGIVLAGRRQGALLGRIRHVSAPS